MKKKLVATLVALTVGALAATPIFAAQFLTYGYSSKTIPVKSYSYNATWQTPMDQSLANWNNAGAKISFTKSSSSSNTITAAQFNDTSYGVNYGSVSGSTLKSFRIELNSRTISADATNLSNFIQSVFVHELGHSIWLADNPDTSSASIMKYTRDRNSMTKPQTYDINGVKSKY